MQHLDSIEKHKVITHNHHLRTCSRGRFEKSIDAYFSLDSMKKVLPNQPVLGNFAMFASSIVLKTGPADLSNRLLPGDIRTS